MENQEIQPPEQEDKPKLFAVFIQLHQDKETYLDYNCTFEQIVENVIVPYNTKEPFFVDGINTDATKIKRIKILVQKPDFTHKITDLHHTISGAKFSRQRAHIERLKALQTKDQQILSIVETLADDITPQVMSAYVATEMSNIEKREQYQADRPRLYEQYKTRILDTMQAIATSVATAYITNAMG